MEYLNHVTFVTGLAVLLVQEILKLKAIPLSFANRYPVPTAIVLSAIASAVVVWQDAVATPAVWTEWIALGVTVLLVAAITYNMTIRNWDQLREMEGPGK